MRAFPTPEKYQRTLLLPSLQNERHAVVAWTPGRMDVLIAQPDSDLSRLSYSVKRAPIAFDELLAGDFNNDGVTDLVFVDQERRLLSVVTDLSVEMLKAADETAIPVKPSFLTVGDFNNDDKLDILAVDRNTPGIVPLTGNGKGGFVAGRSIAPYNAVGAVCLTHLNDDEIIDIVLYDWVKSRLHMLYGVGRGRFLDQSVFSVQGDISRILPTSFTREPGPDLFLFSKKPAEGQIWKGNGLGDFRAAGKIAFDQPPIDVSVADVNNDGLNDIVVLHERGAMTVYFTPEEEQAFDHVEFAAGGNPRSMILDDWDNDGKVDAVVLQAENQSFTFFLNAGRQSVLNDSLTFAVGVQPSSVLVRDINRDGIEDIALLNTKSSTLSLLFGRKRGGILGQITSALSPGPEFATFHSFKDSVARFVISYPQTQMLSFLSVNAKENSFVNAVIPVEGSAEFLSISSPPGESAEFVTFNTPSGAEASSLSFFEKLGATAFVERSFRLSPPAMLLGAGVGDLNKDSLLEIVYVYKANDTSSVELGVAFGDSATSMKQRIVFQDLTFPDAKKAYVWVYDLDRDDTLDLVLLFPQDSGQLYAARGTGGGFFSDPKLVSDSLGLENRSELQILDADGDGRADIVFNSKGRKGVGWMKGKGDCTFGSVSIIVPGTTVSGFAIGDLNGDGKNDIAVVIGNQGILKIFDGRSVFSEAGSYAKPQ